MTTNGYDAEFDHSDSSDDDFLEEKDDEDEEIIIETAKPFLNCVLMCKEYT